MHIESGHTAYVLYNIIWHHHHHCCVCTCNMRDASVSYLDLEWNWLDLQKKSPVVQLRPLKNQITGG